MTNAQEHFKSGFKAYTTGDYTGAIAAFERALELEPDHLEALRSIAMAWLKNGNAEKAVAYAQQLSELAPTDPMSWTSLSLFLMKAGRPKEAEDAAAKGKLQTWKVQLKQGPVAPAAPGTLNVLDAPASGPTAPTMPQVPTTPQMPQMPKARPAKKPDER
jgi:Flp pilus assembly protein TadD